jgi:fucose 4-O-acetylase-like acetyltransferase
MRQRIEWIDIAKGLGMLIVIAGHTVSLRYSYPLYAFHMPLFFFLSGLVMKDKKEYFKDFVLNKTNALLRPWVIMLLISFLVCCIIPQWRQAISFRAILADLYTSNTNILQNSSLWYLVCYFFVLVLFYPITRVKRTPSVIVLFFVLAVSFLWMKTILDKSTLPFHRLPFKIDSALVALVFFCIANWNKEIIMKFFSNHINGMLILLISVLSGWLCVFNDWSNINSLDFGRYRLLYYPIALLGILSICLISQWISSLKSTGVRYFFQFYGKNSLLIFGFQSLFIRLYLLFFNNIQSLEMQLYGDNPVIHQAGAFIVVSFVLSPSIVFLFEFLRKKNIKII